MDLERVYTRIIWFSQILIGAGAVVYFLLGGWRTSLGFLLGGALAYLNFHWLKRTVFALGDLTVSKPPKLRTAVLLGLRYLLLGGSAYAILRFSEISVASFLVGLFAPTAAVMLVILIELFYART